MGEGGGGGEEGEDKEVLRGEFFVLFLSRFGSSCKEKSKQMAAYLI